MKQLLILSLVVNGVLQTGLDAVEMFYDPAGQGGGASFVTQPDRLRSIPLVRPFPRYGNVGIHYWFQREGGAPLAEEQAAAAGGAFTLHIRNNVDVGYMSVWSIGGGSGRQLTPAQGQYNGVRVAGGSEYVVPELVTFGSQVGMERLIIVFSRSQTEQAGDALHALRRFQTISGWTASDGLPQVVRETVSTVRTQIGTYIVNRRGNPVVAEIALQAR